MTVLLEGSNGCGKSALAAKVALESNFPFVKLISPESFVGYTEQGKVSQIVKIFEDAYKSPLSLIVLDDLERLIEFIHIGPRFSNHVLQTLLVLIKKKPANAARKLMVVATTAMKHILKEMELVDAFNVVMKVPLVQQEDEFVAVLKKFGTAEAESREIAGRCGDLPIKTLMLVAEMAVRKTGAPPTFESFAACLKAMA